MDDIKRMLIERECEKLIVAYAHCNDLGAGQGVADLFTEDGVLDIPGNKRTGRGEIEGSIEKRPKGMFMRHVSANAAISVLDEDHAEGTSYLIAYIDPTPGETPRPMAPPTVIGQYYDKFVRTEKGWKIANRRAEIALGAPAR